MYTHILFDMDDTILDFQKAQLASFKYVLEKYGTQFSEDIYLCYEDINHFLWSKFDEGAISKDVVQNERFARFFDAIGKHVDGKQVNSLYQESLSSQTWLIPHAKEVCFELSKHHTLSIVTNGVGITQKKRFLASEISPYFSHILISEDIGVAKPNKQFFDKAFNLIQCTDRKKILLVGDSLSSDIQGANNVGIDSCWFNPKGAIDDRELKITYMITDLRQLMDIA